MKRTHTELISPIISNEGRLNPNDIRQLERADVVVSQTLIEQGPASIES